MSRTFCNCKTCTFAVSMDNYHLDCLGHKFESMLHIGSPWQIWQHATPIQYGRYCQPINMDILILKQLLDQHSFIIPRLTSGSRQPPVKVSNQLHSFSIIANAKKLQERETELMTHQKKALENSPMWHSLKWQCMISSKNGKKTTPDTHHNSQKIKIQRRDLEIPFPSGLRRHVAPFSPSQAGIQFRPSHPNFPSGISHFKKLWTM